MKIIKRAFRRAIKFMISLLQNNVKQKKTLLLRTLQFDLPKLPFEITKKMFDLIIPLFGWP